MFTPTIMKNNQKSRVFSAFLNVVFVQCVEIYEWNIFRYMICLDKARFGMIY